MERRQTSKASKKVESPAAYFRDALARGYAKPPKLASPSTTRAEQGKVSRERVRQLYDQVRRDEIRGLYRGLGEEEREALLGEFEQNGLGENNALRVQFSKRGLESPMVQVAFLDWYATKLWGAPTEEQLFDFVLAHGKLLG